MPSATRGIGPSRIVARTWKCRATAVLLFTCNLYSFSHNKSQPARAKRGMNGRRGHSFTVMVGSGGAKGRRGISSGVGVGSDETKGQESSRAAVGLKSVENKHQEL